MKLILFFSKKRKNRIFFMSFDFFRKKKKPSLKFFPKVKNRFCVLQQCYETCRTTKLYLYF